ncbi:MAG: hypothetical protein IPI67_06420 [Myxococcales bacterium]|nr:hypothetical protein [Myxococcales bacterium]
MPLFKLSFAGFSVAAFVFALSSWSAPRPPAVPLESPDEAECFEWKYPKNKACGDLSGKTECKASSTISASDDDDKKDKCKPKKGDTCNCE